LANISAAELRSLFLQNTPLIDVRAPVEFQQGSLPGAVNLPLMNDDERAAVGTTYKKSGREAAIQLGHELVSGTVKETRIEAWLEQIRQKPETVLYCFRGGLRSQISQQWLKERGVNRPLIEGGFKKVRQFLRDEIEQFSAKHEFLLLTGPTGSAKTHILNQANFYPNVDLEALACHRGSAFGASDRPQPSQVDFENRLAVELMRIESRCQTQKPLFEDESRMIGRSVLPESFFNRMRESAVILVEESFERRVENIFTDYVLNTAIAKGPEAVALQLFAKYRTAVQAISRKLGGLKTQEVLQELAISEKNYREGQGLESNKAWIAPLLHSYYDPLYSRSFEKREPKILFRGCGPEVVEFLRNFRAGC